MTALHRGFRCSILLAVALVASCTDASLGPPEGDAASAGALDRHPVAGSKGLVRRGSRAHLALTPEQVAGLPSLAGIRIAYDMSHNSGRQQLTNPLGTNENGTVFGQYIARGATIQVITAFTAEVLGGYDVLWLEEDFTNGLSTAEQAVLSNFVAGGGGVIICCEDWPSASPLTVFGFDYAANSHSGTTTNITPHSVTAGVASITYSGSVRSFTVPTEAARLVRDADDSHPTVAVREFGSGRVAVLDDELCLNGVAGNTDNELLCNNLMTYAAARESQSTQTIANGEAATVTVAEDSDGDGDEEQVAGADFPANAFENDPNDPNDDFITITVKLRTVEPGDAPCHSFLIGQVGRCMEVTATKQDGSDAKLAQAIRVGICLDASRALDIYKFESATDAPRQLEQTDVTDFLDCSGFQLSSAPPRNWIQGLAARIGKWITPRSAYAADRGMGGIVDDEHLSFFTWAAPMGLTSAALVVNVRGSGKDAFQVSGVFDLVATKGFDPAATESGFDPALAIPIRFGDNTFTVPAGGLWWSALLKRWVYSSFTTTGVTAFSIDPLSGKFTVAGLVPTEGDSPPAFRAFTIRLGNRLRGSGLLCGVGTAYSCSYEPH